MSILIWERSEKNILFWKILKQWGTVIYGKQEKIEIDCLQKEKEKFINFELKKVVCK